MQKSSMLNIVSIILIVFSVLSLISAIVTLTIFDWTFDLIQESIDAGEFEDIGEVDYFEVVKKIFDFITIYMFVSAAIMLIAGVLGVVQQNVTLCWVFGALCVLTSLILGILYLVGTKKMQDEQAEFLIQQEEKRYFE